MKILERLSNLVRSNINSAIDKMSDPGKEIDLLVEQMEDEARQARVALRDQIAHEKIAQKKVDEAYRNVARWQEHAERAVRAGEDDLAKEALRRVADAEQALESQERVLSEQSQAVAKMTEQLKANDRKLVEIKSRKETLKARARVSKQAITGEGGDAFSRFDQLVSQIEMNEHQVEAMAEMAADGTLGPVQGDRDRETEEKFRRLGGGSDQDRELDARLRLLKAQVNAGGDGQRPALPSGQGGRASDRDSGPDRDDEAK